MMQKTFDMGERDAHGKNKKACTKGGEKLDAVNVVNPLQVF